MRAHSRCLAALLALALLPGCITVRPAAGIRKLPEARTFEFAGTYRHYASGIRLPATIGDAQRSSVTCFDEEGLDASAFYRVLRTAPIGISVIIYPAPVVEGGSERARNARRSRLLEESFVEIRQEIVEAHPGSVFAVETDGDPPTPRSSIRERRTVSIQSGMIRNEARLSLLDDGWWVLFRSTSMAGLDHEATAAIDQIAAGIPWQ